MGVKNQVAAESTVDTQVPSLGYMKVTIGGIQVGNIFLQEGNPLHESIFNTPKKFKLNMDEVRKWDDEPESDNGLYAELAKLNIEVNAPTVLVNPSSKVTHSLILSVDYKLKSGKTGNSLLYELYLYESKKRHQTIIAAINAVNSGVLKNKFIKLNFSIENLTNSSSFDTSKLA